MAAQVADLAEPPLVKPELPKMPKLPDLRGVKSEVPKASHEKNTRRIWRSGAYRAQEAEVEYPAYKAERLSSIRRGGGAAALATLFAICSLHSSRLLTHCARERLLESCSLARCVLACCSSPSARSSEVRAPAPRTVRYACRLSACSEWHCALCVSA